MPVNDHLCADEIEEILGFTEYRFGSAEYYEAKAKQLANEPHWAPRRDAYASLARLLREQEKEQEK